MRTTKYILVLVTVLIFSSCDDNSSGLQDSFTIEGTVFYNNMRLKNASITLDKQNALSTLSDNDGNFKIPNVPKGDHNLGVSKTFSEQVPIYPGVQLTQLIFVSTKYSAIIHRAWMKTQVP